MNIRLIFLLMSLVMSLSACQTPFIADSLTKSGDVLFIDDFSTTDGGWLRLVDEAGEMAFDTGGFRFKIDEPGFDYWSTPGLVFGDVRIEVDSAKLDGPDINRFGIICRYQDPMNYYFFIISSDGFYTIGKIKDDVIVLLGQKEMHFNKAIQKGVAINHLRADCVGDTLTFYINGSPVAMATDEEYLTGDVGLLAGTFDEPGVDILFDNFVVLKP